MSQSRGSLMTQCRLCSHYLFLEVLGFKQIFGAAHMWKEVVQDVCTHPWVLVASGWSLHPFVLSQFSSLLAGGEAIIN